MLAIESVRMESDEMITKGNSKYKIQMLIAQISLCQALMFSILCIFNVNVHTEILQHDNFLFLTIDVKTATRFIVKMYNQSLYNDRCFYSLNDGFIAIYVIDTVNINAVVYKIKYTFVQ